MPVPYENIGLVDVSVGPDLANLKDKNMIVTGGSSGLGAAYVQAFLKAGAYVTNADIQPPKDYQSPSDSKFQFIQCDVTNFQNQVSAFKAARDLSPSKQIDIVIANAGISGQDPIFTLSTSDDPPDPPELKILEIDLIGMLYTAHIAMHYWNFDSRPAEQKCLIIKSSLAGYVDLPGGTCYQASKYGVRGLMVNLRGSGRCRTALVAPWFIRTAVMSDTVAEQIDGRLRDVGSDWAVAADSVTAVMKIASDESINGRSVAVVPRCDVPEGYMDMDVDDYPAGSLMAKYRNLTDSFQHRTLPKEKQ